jgi:hypothetical protein
MKSLFTLILLSISFTSFAQSSIQLSAGIGIPELVNTSIKLRISESAFGIGVGTDYMFDSRKPLYTVTGSWSEYISGQSRYRKGRTNYLRFAYTNTWSKNEPGTGPDGSDQLICAYFGRDCFLNSRTGIAFDIGLLAVIDKLVNFYYPLFPAVGISLFWRSE